ncbi:MAG: glucosaminidase domain-containing protein [Sneathiella sp.]|nr:glucosaminidase domain-containing protein [Sneathiella sp.]
MKKPVLVLLLTGLAVASGAYGSYATLLKDKTTADAETVSIRSFEDFSTFFDDRGYSIQKWKEGEQDVPRLVIMDIPEEWRKRIAPELPVPEKKRTFFRLTIPLAFVANHGIALEQKKLSSLKNKLNTTGRLDPEDVEWLNEKAAEYAVKVGEIDKEIFVLLEERIDIIPPSLMIAQMAEESGWGTSRFAAEGNALFGQWSYTGGIKPEDQRSGKGDYRIKAFKTPLASIRAYMANLNTHEAYAGFRKLRAELRAKGKPITGPELVGTLIDYSERREAYVKILEEIMESNSLPPLDHVRLADGETVFIRLDE